MATHLHHCVGDHFGLPSPLWRWRHLGAQSAPRIFTVTEVLGGDRYRLESPPWDCFKAIDSVVSAYRLTRMERCGPNGELMTKEEQTAHRLTNTAARHLTTAALDTQGLLPQSVSRRVLKQLLEDGFAYRSDADGFRLSVEDALELPKSPAFISPAGRLALLATSQVRALTRRVTASGRLDDDTAGPDAAALVSMYLAEFQSDGERQSAGDSGVPGLIAVRTSLGGQVAALVAEPDDA